MPFISNITTSNSSIDPLASNKVTKSFVDIRPIGYEFLNYNIIQHYNIYQKCPLSNPVFVKNNILVLPGITKTTSRDKFIYVKYDLINKSATYGSFSIGYVPSDTDADTYRLCDGYSHRLYYIFPVYSVGNMKYFAFVVKSSIMRSDDKSGEHIIGAIIIDYTDGTITNVGRLTSKQPQLYDIIHSKDNHIYIDDYGTIYRFNQDSTLTYTTLKRNWNNDTMLNIEDTGNGMHMTVMSGKGDDDYTQQTFFSEYVYSSGRWTSIGTTTDINISENIMYYGYYGTTVGRFILRDPSDGQVASFIQLSTGTTELTLMRIKEFDHTQNIMHMDYLTDLMISETFSLDTGEICRFSSGSSTGGHDTGYFNVPLISDVSDPNTVWGFSYITRMTELSGITSSKDYNPTHILKMEIHK